MNKSHVLLMKTAMLAGKTLLSSGAETWRVEDTMRRILNKSGCKTIEVVAIMTSIMATLDDETIEPFTYVTSVSNVGMHIGKIIEVNEISRNLCEDKISLEKAYEQLKAVGKKEYSKLLYNIAIVLTVSGFAMFFGGGISEILISLAVGTILGSLITFGKWFQINDFIHTIINGAGISFSTMVLVALFSSSINTEVVNTEIIIISGIMPLVPGVAITNGVRDVLEGDYISGNSRILKAFLTATGIAIGIGVGISTFHVLT